MNNTTLGNKTEKTASSIFREKGYWVYNCPKSSSGSQPFDLIAIKGGWEYKVWFIDGKHVRKDEVSFTLNRIEPNQWASMEYANQFAQIRSETLGFVIQFERTGEFYWLPYETALDMKNNGVKSINLSKLQLLEEVINENSDK